MTKYTVYGLYTASKKLGAYEAASKEEAIEMCDADPEASHHSGLCYQCSREIELNDDPYKLEAEVCDE